jgi:hypothetical protein
MPSIIYIGAFIEITKMPSILEEVEDEQFEYPNCSKKCDHSFLTRKAKFCPSCGKPIKLRTEILKTEHQWDMADVSEFLDDDNLEWSNGWGMNNRDVDKILVPCFSGKWVTFAEPSQIMLNVSEKSLNKIRKAETNLYI